MAELDPSGLETADSGSDGWNAIYTTNFQKINDHVKSTQATVGDETDNVTIDKVNAIRLNGDATVFKRIIIQGLATLDGTAPPTKTKWLDNGSGSTGVRLKWFAAGSENDVEFQVTMPTDWKEGSNITPFVAWVPKTISDEDPTGQKVRWGLEYTTIENKSGVFGNTTLIYAETHDPVAELAANTYYITAFKSISMTDKEIDAHFACRLFRDGAHANDTYEDEAGLLFFGFAYESDAMGANYIFAKDEEA